MVGRNRRHGADGRILGELKAGTGHHGHFSAARLQSCAVQIAGNTQRDSACRDARFRDVAVDEKTVA